MKVIREDILNEELSKWRVDMSNEDCNKGKNILLTSILNLINKSVIETDVTEGSIIEFTDEERYKNFKECGIPYDGRCSNCNSAVFMDDCFCASCGTKLVND